MTGKGYEAGDLQDTFTRYVSVSVNATARQTNNDRGSRVTMEARHDFPVADEKSASSPHGYSIVADVADKNPESADEKHDWFVQEALRVFPGSYIIETKAEYKKLPEELPF